MLRERDGVFLYQDVYIGGVAEFGVWETTMTLRNRVALVAIASGLTFLNVPAAAQGRSSAMQISAVPTIEDITFQGLNDAEQAMILKRIALRNGDVLSVDARRRIAEELRATGTELGKTLTFSYKPGSKSGTAKLSISNGC